MLNFIVNAHSGRGKGQKTLKKIINYCYSNGFEYTVHLTSAPGHATRIARALCENNSHTLVAVGGDGTFHEVLNGIISPESTALGFIPSGRGNDFAKGAGIPLNTKKALKRITDGKTKFYDYIKVSDKRCLNITGTGLDVDVLLRVAGRRGKLSYLGGLIYCLKHFDPYDITVEAKDGEAKNYSCIMIGVCNGNRLGGGIKLSPLSKTDDGVMDIVIMSMPKDNRIFRLLPKFVRGKHMKLEVTTHFTSDSVKIRTAKNRPIQLDGEIYNDLEFNCSLIKNGLKSF